MFKRTAKSTLVIICALALCAVAGATLGACNPNNSKTSAASYRWENFDDGSDVLSLDVPYIPSNSSSLEFNVILEQGKLSDNISAQNVELSSALEGWKVDSATKKDNVTLAIKASRPDNLANNGASVACVTLSSDAVVMSEDSADSSGSGASGENGSGSSSSNSSSGSADSTSSSGNAADSSSSNSGSSQTTSTDEQNKIHTSDEINDMKGVEWPEDAVIVNEDKEAVSKETEEVVADTPEETSALVSDIENGKINSEEDLKPYEEKEKAENADGAASSEGTESADASSSGTESENSENANTEDSETTALPYAVYAVFANPALTVDFEKSELKDKTFSATINASDFVLSNNMTKDSFSLNNADGCSIENVKYVGEQVVEVKVSLPNKDDASALDNAELILKGSANETQADVVCSIKVLEPWLSLELDHTDANAKTMTLTAQLNDAKGKITKDNTTLQVNDNEVSPTSVSANDDGTYSITLDSQSVSDNAVVSASVSGVKNVLGKDAETQSCSTLVSLEEQTRGLEKLKPENFLPSLGKKGLVALAKLGWEKFYTNVLDPNNTLGVYDVSNNEILANIVKVQQQLIDIETQIKALDNDVLVGQKASIVNDAKRLISRIKTQELQLDDEVTAIYKEGNETKRKEAIRTFADKEKVTIDSLATNLGELYDVIMNADSATNHDLISTYDELMALSYNWGAQTYPYRQDFRETLARVWTNSSQIVDLAYAVQTEDAEKGQSNAGGSKRSYLNSLQQQTNDINTLINTTHAIGIKEYRYGGDWGSVSRYCTFDDQYFENWIADLTSYYDEDDPYADYVGDDDDSNNQDDDWYGDWVDDENELDDITYFSAKPEDVRNIQNTVRQYREAGAGKDSITYYCNTTGAWYQTLNGKDTENKWDKALNYVVKHNWKKNDTSHAASPFREYTKSKKSYRPNEDWDKLYANTTEVNLMVPKLHDNQTLKEEIESLDLKTAKYLVTSEKYSYTYKGLYYDNDWYFDTYEVAKSSKSDKAFTREKKHYDASIRYDTYALVKHTNWYTPASDMFTLKKIKTK